MDTLNRLGEEWKMNQGIKLLSKHYALEREENKK